MKTQTVNLLEPLQYSEIKNLLTEVKETLAKDFVHSNGKKFTAANLWNIQRHGRTITRRQLCAW
jgi:hypothetical protein